MSIQAMEEPGDVEEVFPPWGSLPAEVYILQHWDPDSLEVPAHQRKKLVEEYLEEGYHDASTLSPMIPTADQVATILSPWRTSTQRDIATNPGQIGCVWLRTDYSSEMESAHASLLDQIDLQNTLDVEDRLLDDEGLYEFNSNWREILFVMPELVVITDAEHWGWSEGVRAKEEEDLVKAKAYLAGENIEGVHVKMFNDMRRVFPVGEADTQVLDQLRSSVHKACVVNYIIVEDKEALETTRLLMLFLNCRGKVVRWSRVTASDAEMFGGLWLDGCWSDVTEWTDASIGDEYQVGGAWGHLLHA